MAEADPEQPDMTTEPSPLERLARVPEVLPVLPLKDMVVYPGMVLPLFVGRRRSLRGLEHALNSQKFILLTAQRNSEEENPGTDDLYRICTVAECMQTVRLPDGMIRAVVEGVARFEIQEFTGTADWYEARGSLIAEPETAGVEIEALTRSALGLFERAVKMGRPVAPESLEMVRGLRSPGRLADLVAHFMNLSLEVKQKLLETIPVDDRLTTLIKELSRELEVLEIEQKIHSRVKKELEDAQKEFYLRERMKAIQHELGERDERGSEIDELRNQIKAAGMPEEVESKALKEVERLERIPAASPEVVVVRTYLDWLLAMPWKVRSEEKHDIEEAARILDEDHYGLAKVKERILEFLAVRKLNPGMKGPILAFMGPPGVGKTSMGKSIARATGRKFVRISLGGVRDEGEIRGHRRTYVGALPGRIIQGMRTAAAKNPVFMMDEIDKIGIDFRGDPSAALLEVLDPEQNDSFSDHYLEAPFSLSEVMFILTGNLLDTIPPALRDRMEVIEFPGYIEEEKLQIARLFLVPKQLKEHGLNAEEIEFSKAALMALIRNYTREAGVRNLEREVASICRKIARAVASKGAKPVRVTPATLRTYLGPVRFRYGVAEKEDEVGVATGLGWTPVGGDILSIEVSLLKGKGALTLTGHLGEVMQESAKAALSYARARAAVFGVDTDFYRKIDVHIHIPQGQIPKDGPSAGITLATALVSALAKRPVRADVAMTGEITLRGRVLPVGGIKEKVLAAHRAGIRTLILPAENERDLDEIPDHVKRQMRFIFVEKMDQVLENALRGGIPQAQATAEQPSQFGQIH